MKKVLNFVMFCVQFIRYFIYTMFANKCPDCGSSLNETEDTFTCPMCDRKVKTRKESL